MIMKNHLDITYAADCRDTFYFQKCMLNIFFSKENKIYPCLFKYAFWTAETLSKQHPVIAFNSSDK